jgi:glutamate---cysteine ligase / carboxylate-amine ligase
MSPGEGARAGANPAMSLEPGGRPTADVIPAGTGSSSGAAGRPVRHGVPSPRRHAQGAVPAFQPSAAFTVGAEDELLLVDAHGHLLGAAAAPVMATLRRTAPIKGTVTGEVFVDQVELGTPACATAEQVGAALGELRGRLMASDARLMAVGVHPEADFGTAQLVRSGRYARTVEEFAGLFRTPTAAFQVHVGLPDTKTAILAYRGLRNRLSLLRALAAASPYWHGQDSGLASARSAITRSYPRVTMPPILRSWEDYVRVTERIMVASELPDYTYVWWDLRPQPRLGTIEVRVMDAQHSLARIAGLTALVQGLAKNAIEAPDPDDLPEDVVAANDFRACRYGLDTKVVDVDGVMRPLHDIAVRELAQARTALAPDGFEGPLDVVESMLSAPPEAERQRRLYEERGMPALLDDLAARTTDLQG